MMETEVGLIYNEALLVAFHFVIVYKFFNIYVYIRIMSNKSQYAIKKIIIFLNCSFLQNYQTYTTTIVSVDKKFNKIRIKALSTELYIQ